MKKNKNFETKIATFHQQTNNSILKNFKKEYQHLFQPHIFSNLLHINHVSIIKLQEIDKIDKTLTYEYLKSNHSITLHNLKKILKDIAISIDYLHQNSIVHIDINDTNILINKSLEIKLNDFDFIEIMTSSDDDLKQIDIHSYIILVYRIIQLPKQWNAIKALSFTYKVPSQDSSSCLDFFHKLELTE